MSLLHKIYLVSLTIKDSRAVESATDKVRLRCLQFTPWGAALLRTLREHGMLVHRATLYIYIYIYIYMFVCVHTYVTHCVHDLCIQNRER